MGDWLSGRASRLHREGRGFKSLIAHHKIQGISLISGKYEFSKAIKFYHQIFSQIT